LRISSARIKTKLGLETVWAAAVDPLCCVLAPDKSITAKESSTAEAIEANSGIVLLILLFSTFSKQALPFT
jgi:hypothetical protein